MNTLHYIGFDVHKKTFSFFVKTAAGEIVEEGSMLARRAEGRPVNPNSYFVDRARACFPQMDVWPGCRLGRYKRSHAVPQLSRATPASRPRSSKRPETSVSS